ncbi:MAG TPA: 50S ribosomal protein L3 N(5)-glutamine methyltransferase [Casimicrobium huifangae]|nr:50S ribosomal protein L3 N(5)-glutamine methyltransferase [Casimicrobium huifangae]
MTALRQLEFPDAAPLELVSVGDWWRFAVSCLVRSDAEFGQSSADAGQDALFLVLGALDLPLDSFDQMHGFALTNSERKHVFNALRKRVLDRVPTAYVLGFAEQMGLRFVVDERVLIPRSYIGELLAGGLRDYIDDPASIASVLDLCTGSGCLAILAANAFPDADVTAVDISADALDVARENVALHGLDDVVSLHQGDLFAPLGKARFDLIISNPPYVTAESMAMLPQEFRHEPELALAAGDDGNDILRRMLQEAKAHLTPDGILLVDMGHNRDLVEAAFPRLPFMWLATESGDAGVFMLHARDLP